MSRHLLLGAIGVPAIIAAGCTQSPDTATTKKEHKVYYAHSAQTGSHLQRAYVDSTPPPDQGSDNGNNGNGASQRAFAPSGVASEGGRR